MIKKNIVIILILATSLTNAFSNEMKNVVNKNLDRISKNLGSSRPEIEQPLPLAQEGRSYQSFSSSTTVVSATNNEIKGQSYKQTSSAASKDGKIISAETAEKAEKGYLQKARTNNWQGERESFIANKSKAQGQTPQESFGYKSTPLNVRIKKNSETK